MLNLKYQNTIANSWTSILNTESFKFKLINNKFNPPKPYRLEGFFIQCLYL